MFPQLLGLRCRQGNLVRGRKIAKSATYFHMKVKLEVLKSLACNSSAMKILLNRCPHPAHFDSVILLLIHQQREMILATIGEMHKFWLCYCISLFQWFFTDLHHVTQSSSSFGSFVGPATVRRHDQKKSS